MSEVNELLDAAQSIGAKYLENGSHRAFRLARLAARTAEAAARFSGTREQLAVAQWLYGFLGLVGHQRGHTGTGILVKARQRLREVAESPATPEELRAPAVDALAAVLLARHEATGEASYLHDIVELVSGALRALPAGAPEARRGVYLTHLGVTESARARHQGNAVLADAAARRLREAMALLPEGSHEYALAVAQSAHAEQVAVEMGGLAHGQRDTADALVERARRAAAAAERLGPAGSPDVLGPGAPYLHLSNALCLRFDARRDREDLAEAERSVSRALALVPEGNTARPIYLMARGSVATRRYLATARSAEGTREGAEAHLDRAVADLQGAVRLLPLTAPGRALYLGKLAEALQNRYQYDTLRTADLRKATRRAEQAVAAAGSQAAASGPLLTLCDLRVLAYQRTPDLFAGAALTLAESSLARALCELPIDHPAIATVTLLRGQLYSSVFRRTAQEEDLDSALLSYAFAARHETGSLLRRATAANLGGLLAQRSGRHDTASELLGLAVELLEAMTEPTLLGWYSRIDHIEQFGGLAVNACAAHLSAGRPEEALAVLDRGRGLLLAPVWGLASRAAGLPEQDLKLYREAVWSSFRSDQAAEATTSSLAAGPFTSPAPSAGPDQQGYSDPREHRQAAGRILAAHASKLAPAGIDIEALARRLGSGAAVALSTTALRSDALILTAKGIEVVPLPGMAPDAAETYSRRLHIAAKARTDESVTVFQEVTGWLWESLAAPVLQGLERLTSQLPERVYWVPSGPLCLLPLHAAGLHSTSPDVVHDTLLGLFVSSYAATLRTLERDLSRPTEPVGPALLVAPGRSGRMGPVTVPAPLFEAPGALQLTESQAGPREVLDALAGRAVVHFACHGTTDPSDPVASALHLAKGKKLPFVSVARTDLSAARLAFLAACETALTGHRFADEALHMASAFQLAGFPHVIGTLWEVYDDLTASVSRSVYANLSAGPAKALHEAVRELRSSDQGIELGPLAWAPFIHFGV